MTAIFSLDKKIIMLRSDWLGQRWILPPLYAIGDWWYGKRKIGECFRFNIFHKLMLFFAQPPDMPQCDLFQGAEAPSVSHSAFCRTMRCVWQLWTFPHDSLHVSPIHSGGYGRCGWNHYYKLLNRGICVNLIMVGGVGGDAPVCASSKLMSRDAQRIKPLALKAKRSYVHI